MSSGGYSTGGGGGGGTGTVTSVALSLPVAVFSVSGSPVVNNGTLTATFTNQNANLVFAGPASGAAATPTFRSLVNADLPSGTYVNLPEVGNIITENWASLVAWTKVGAQTFTVASNQLTVVGGTPAGITLSNYYRASGYGNTQYMEWTVSCSIIVGTINATSWGVALGLQSQNTDALLSCQFGIMMDSTNKGKIFAFANNSNTVLAQTASALTIAAGDTLRVTLKRINNTLVCKVTNTTSSPNDSISLPVSNPDLTTSITPNVGQFAIYGMGGTHTVLPYAVDINQKVGSDLLCIGDSRTFGSATTNTFNNYVSVLGRLLNGVVDNYAGSGNRNQDYVATEILALAPRCIMILSGLNNIGFGDTAVQANTKMQTFVNALIAGGYVLGTNLFICDELPAATNLIALNALYRSTFSAGILSGFNAFLATTGGFLPISTMWQSDNVHPTDYGHMLIGQNYAAELPISKNNKPQGYQSGVFYRNNGKITVGSTVPLTALSFSAEIFETNNGCQVHFCNNSSQFGGGYLYSNVDNQAALIAGYYIKAGTSQFTAAATTGSSINANGGNINFTTFSTAAVGDNITSSLLVRFQILNNGNIGINGASHGGGVFVTFMANATTLPTTNPVGGGIIYINAGALTYRGSAGTVTVLAPA